ncbi:MAG TPA: alpha/beta hydrolase [Bacilli bacterium]|nr:alpha/beta hydrolase [Bacilli bacterium]
MTLSGAGTRPVSYDWTEVFTAEQMLRDFEDFTQEELLTSVKCPVLILHGNNDAEEQLLSSITKQGLHLLPDGSRLEIIGGATHSFMEHLPLVEHFASEWYREHFALTP